MENDRKKFLDYIIEKDFKKPYFDTLRFYDIKEKEEVRYIFDKVFGDRYKFTTILNDDLRTITHGFLTYIKLYDENGNMVYSEDSDGINYDPIELSGAGEPGIYFSNDKDWGTNPCCESY